MRPTKYQRHKTGTTCRSEEELEAARERRRAMDHLRYLRHHEARLELQREYYNAHREECRERVRRCQKRKKQ